MKIERSVWLLPMLLALAGACPAQSVVLIADVNGRYGSTEYDRAGAAVEAIVERQPRFVISAGDMVAGQKRDLDDDHLRRMWSAFDRTVTQPLAQAGIPLLVTPGNHDASAYPEFSRDRDVYRAHWAERTQGFELLAGSEWPERYAARVGSILLVAFNGTRSGPLTGAERAYVADLLERHGGSAEVTIVSAHLPMWPLAQRRESQILNDAELLGLLHDHGVDVFASGHHHLYYPGVDEAGMLHLSVGPLGGNARAFAGHSRRQRHSFAWLEVHQGHIRVGAMRRPTFREPVLVSDLPTVIDGPLGTLTRLEGELLLRP